MNKYGSLINNNAIESKKYTSHQKEAAYPYKYMLDLAILIRLCMTMDTFNNDFAFANSTFFSAGEQTLGICLDPLKAIEASCSP